jgi:hypothetical protein
LHEFLGLGFGCVEAFGFDFKFRFSGEIAVRSGLKRTKKVPKRSTKSNKKLAWISSGHPPNPALEMGAPFGSPEQNERERER